MQIIQFLSSQTGDNTSHSNIQAAQHCLDHPDLLAQIAAGLDSLEGHLAADCAEVMTLVALEKPELVAPYAQQLAGHISHRNTMARWETVHALACIAPLAPDVIRLLLPKLQRMIQLDKSVIVRDYSVDAVGCYASAGDPCAQEAYPILLAALAAWNGKHAQHALRGLQNVAGRLPDLREEIRVHAEHCLEVGRPVTQKAARSLLKFLESA